MSFRAKYKDVIFARVNHESIELLNYDGKNCNDSKDYNYDDCKQEYIYKVINFGETQKVFFFQKSQLTLNALI